MKLLSYLFAFILILGVVGFAFFTMTTPNIPQQEIQKNIDPDDAFRPAGLAPALSPAPALPPSE